MSGSRWQANVSELVDWFDRRDDELKAFVGPMLAALGKKNQAGADNADAIDTSAIRPSVLPILPLRGVVVYPQTGVPLTVGQARSIKLVDDVVASDRLVGLVTSRKPELEAPGPDDLYRYGVLATVHKMLRAPDGTVRLLVQGMDRFELVDFVEQEPYLRARVRMAPEKIEEGIEIEALARNARDQFQQITQMIPSFPDELVNTITSIEDPLQTAYAIANFQRMELRDAQEILELDSTDAKLRKLVTLLAREAEVLSLGQKIQNEARGEIEKVQREYFLREQMKAIQKELGEKDQQAAEIEELRKKLHAAGLPEEADKQATGELERLSRIPTAAAEYGVIRSYLDWMIELPWSKQTPDNLDIGHARKVLNADHFGLDDVKDRILEFLAIRKLRLERGEESPRSDAAGASKKEGVILCFIGPPGVGKTSLGQSIARAMGRKFVRVSLGGVRDEAEIRGHRRTYIGALPGRILQSLKRTESRNPVFMLDEVDKLTSDFHGDPASSLLEVLDPEQNGQFRDNYLEVAFDLSDVFFIATANTAETIPWALYDRMEVINLSGYTDSEKISIAKGYLIPRQLRENGLRDGEVIFNDEVLAKIIRSYTREAGVRNLERQIGTICRKVGTQIAEGKKVKPAVSPQLVEEYLERPVFHGSEELHVRTSLPGIVPGLAYTPYGGDVLFIEATRMPGGRGFQVTGSVGAVMQESARAALSYVRSRAAELRIASEAFAKNDIHLHIPAGSTPKDGPSAGVTMATALVSLMTGRRVKPKLGMTGEITLRGQVLPVGGVKEKILAAHRNGLQSVILPAFNKVDLEDVPEDIRRSLKFIFADTMEDVLGAALEQKPLSRHVSGAKRLAGISKGVRRAEAGSRSKRRQDTALVDEST